MRRRIFLALTICLLGVIVGAWMLAGGRVLIPLTKRFVDSLADIVATLADEIEESSTPNKRLRQLSKKLQVTAKIRKKKPKDKHHKGSRIIFQLP